MSRQLAFGESAALTPADLRALVGVPLSQAQLDAATAALEPGVIVAGAGTGKTTVMAARVVWLVASGAVAPDQVLGLTFTTKAAAQLAAKVRAALRRPGVLPEGRRRPGEPR
jgi:DNA helicase-2/ATP-dependent DNA helicase PcrA